MTSPVSNHDTTGSQSKAASPSRQASLSRQLRRARNRHKATLAVRKQADLRAAAAWAVITELEWLIIEAGPAR